MALVALAVAGLHGGVYLILTAEARHEMAAIEATHPAEKLRQPGTLADPPPVGSKAYAQWREREALHQAAHVYGRHRAHHDIIRNGLLASFLAQLGVAAWVLVRVASRMGRPSREARAS